MTFWCGSGSADLCLWLMDPDSDPDPGSGSCYFRHRPSRCQQKTKFLFIFSAYYFLKIHLHLFSKIKSQKESQNSRNQGFSNYFCMMMEGSRSPKNMWIRNTGIKPTLSLWLACLEVQGPAADVGEAHVVAGHLGRLGVPHQLTVTVLVANLNAATVIIKWSCQTWAKRESAAGSYSIRI